MSTQEVTKLRKQGELDEALKLAISNLVVNPEDIWNKRAISWVYYELLKRATVNKNFNVFLVQLENIKKLELPETEKYVFDSVAWQVGKILFATDNVEPSLLDIIFNNIKSFSFSKPANSYSFMLKAIKKYSNDWGNFSAFIDWWNLENFQENDFQKFVMDNGKSIPSLAEGVYILLAKQLLQQPINTNAIRDFIPKISDVSVTYTSMQYPPYYYAKLLIALGDKENFIKAFLPFAKKKSRDFWVWNLMSENFEINSNEYFSCLCKAASCNAQDKFTGDVREKLANVFIKKEMYAEAKYEFQKIIESRQQEGWKLRDKHLGWQNFSWWINTEASKNNMKLYLQNIDFAESLLYADMQEDIVVVERVNKEKTVVNFVASKEKHGFFNYARLKVKPKVGEVYAVRFEERKDKTSNFYRAKTMLKTDKTPNIDIYKKVTGELKINTGNSFGFVKNIFVSPQIISKFKLKNRDKINVEALQTYNSKRKAWGWNVINVEK